MTELIFSFPYKAEDKTSKAALKTFSSQESRIIEVSFPNARLNVLKVVTDDYKLYVSKVSKTFLKEYCTLGKELASAFHGLSKGETKECPSMTLKLCKEIATVQFNYEALVPFKMKADGWFVLQEEEVFFDFFAE